MSLVSKALLMFARIFGLSSICCVCLMFALKDSYAQAIELADIKLTAPAWQRVNLGKTLKYDFPLYANHDLTQTDDKIKEIVIVLHGLGRNGDGYFTAAQSTLDQVRPDQTDILLIAPNFVAPDDQKKGFTGMPHWAPTAWASGQNALNVAGGLSSYEVMDDLLLLLSDKSNYPSVKRIILAGHSAGGQLTQRYAALNHVDEQIRAAGIDLQYVVANPSAFMYFTTDRPSSDTTFGPFAGISACPTYNNYRYGLDEMIPYGAALPAKELLQRYLARPVTYLMGSADHDLSRADLDKSCAAQVQGQTRIERARRYWAYERFVATPWVKINHLAYEVQGIGHDQSKMFKSTCAVKLFFAKDVEPNAVSASCVFKLAQSDSKAIEPLAPKRLEPGA